jgi:TnpA family transposase
LGRLQARDARPRVGRPYSFSAAASAFCQEDAIRHTIYAAKYLSDERYRHKIARQLNKGESLHSLRRQLHYARKGKVTRQQPEQQNEQAWWLTVVTNAVLGAAPSGLCNRPDEADSDS